MANQMASMRIRVSARDKVRVKLEEVTGGFEAASQSLTRKRVASQSPAVPGIVLRRF
jgi:hypothetical protein